MSAPVQDMPSGDSSAILPEFGGMTIHDSDDDSIESEHIDQAVPAAEPEEDRPQESVSNPDLMTEADAACNPCSHMEISDPDSGGIPVQNPMEDLVVETPVQQRKFTRLGVEFEDKNLDSHPCLDPGLCQPTDRIGRRRKIEGSHSWEDRMELLHKTPDYKKLSKDKSKSKEDSEDPDSDRKPSKRKSKSQEDFEDSDGENSGAQSSRSSIASTLSSASKKQLDEAIRRVLQSTSLTSEGVRDKLNISNLRPVLNESSKSGMHPGIQGSQTLGSKSPFVTRSRSRQSRIEWDPSRTPKDYDTGPLSPLLETGKFSKSKAKPLANTKLDVELPAFDGVDLDLWSEEFTRHLRVTGKSHITELEKLDLIIMSCKTKRLKKTVKGVAKQAGSWGEFLSMLETVFPVLETDASIINEILAVPSLPEFPNPARIQELVVDLESLISSLSECTATQKITWLMGKVPEKTFDDCCLQDGDEELCQTYEGLLHVLRRKSQKRERREHMNQNRGLQSKGKLHTLTESEADEKVLYGKGKGKGQGKGQAKDAQKPAEKTGRFAATIECWHCGRQGHYRDKCWYNERAQKTSEGKGRGKGQEQGKAQGRGKGQSQGKGHSAPRPAQIQNPSSIPVKMDEDKDKERPKRDRAEEAQADSEDSKDKKRKRLLKMKRKLIREGLLPPEAADQF